MTEPCHPHDPLTSPSDGPASHADAADPGERVAAEVGALLDEVDDIGVAAEGFDLDAVTRQAELLEQAHEALTAALDDVDR